jgi:hypothetical protein
MPPPAVKTVQDLIHWQYAKIIAQSAGVGKKQYAFIMDRFQKLKAADIFWNEIREYVKEHEARDVCIYCGKAAKLTLEHLFPRALGGPQDEKNLVWVCGSCNSSKANKRPYEFFTHLQGLKGAKYNVPRIAEGKYLKLLHEVFQAKGVLGMNIEAIRASTCPRCNLKPTCVEEGSEGKLSPLCLDGLATGCFAQ